MKKCKGCGVVLQSEKINDLGYTPKIENDLCQRCYRLIHYDDLILDVKDSIQPEKVLKEIEKIEGLVVWVVDLLDLSGSFKLPINRYLSGRDILLVATKRDLLPLTLGAQKLTAFLMNQLKENHIKVKGICVLANYAVDGLKELKEMLKHLALNNRILLMGNANCGKSTLLKELTKQDVTISRYPGTTLAISEYQGKEFTVYDTPGLINKGSCLQYLATKDLVNVIPLKLNKKRSFQIYEEQSFAIAGLVRIDCLKVTKATVVFYVAETLQVKRGKREKANELWNKHYGTLLSPTIKELKDMDTYHYKKSDDKIDICINGLGFVAISGDIKEIKVSVYNQIDITMRKGMI